MSEVIGVLAVFRLTMLLTTEGGPWGILERLRLWLGVRYDEYGERDGTNEFAKLLICPWCTSLWVALVLTQGDVIRTLAFSGGAMLCHVLFGQLQKSA